MINFIMKSSPQTHIHTELRKCKYEDLSLDPKAQIKRQAEQNVPIYKERHGRFLGFSEQKNPTVQSSRFHFRPCFPTTCIHTHINIHTYTHTHTPFKSQAI